MHVVDASTLCCCRCRWYVQFSIFRSFESENSDRHFIGLAFGPFDNNKIKSRWNLLCWYIIAAVLHRRRFQFLFFYFRFIFVLVLFVFRSSFVLSEKWPVAIIFFHSLCIDKTSKSFFSLKNIKFRQPNS